MEREALGQGEPVLHTVSASAFIVMGLELEELQYVSNTFYYLISL
jgi:hypothetical protein